MEGEAEYAFWHVLARDVAYNQLPRASRATRHVAAARWIESKAPGRVEDLADVLAYHYATALDLAIAAGQAEHAADLEAPALRFLGLAGERALGLDTTAALNSCERALAFTPPGHPERAGTLARFGEAAFHAGRYSDAAGALDEAADLFQAGGDPGAAARTLGTLTLVLFQQGDPRWAELAADALALLESLPPGPELVGALTELSRAEILQGRFEAGLGYAGRALLLVEQLGMPRPARAVGYRGLARANLGDPAGLDDLREAIVLATEAGQGREVGLLHNNLSTVVSAVEGPVASLDVLWAGIAFVRSRGLTEATEFLTAGALWLLVDTGEHDQAFELAARIADQLETSANIFDLLQVRSVQAKILTLRGQAAQIAGTLDWLEATARGTGSVDAVVSNLASAAFAHSACEHPDHAAALLSEIEAIPGARESTMYAARLSLMVRTALATGHPDLAERLVAGVERHTPYHQHALAAANAALAESRGGLQAAAEGYADAAQRWQSFGVVPEQALALLGQGRCLLAQGRTTEATQPLQQAREIFQTLQAAPALAETDQLLQRATALSS